MKNKKLTIGIDTAPIILFACDMTTGRTKTGCAKMAGIKAVYFSTEDLGTISYDGGNTDVIVTMAGTPEFFQYDLKGSSNTYTETITKDLNNGTAFFAQALSLTFPILSKSMHKELKLIVWSSPTVIIQDFNDNYLVMGLISGADANGGTIVTGGARGDLSGYTLTMAAEEQTPGNFLNVDITTTTATISGVQETPT